MKITEVIVEDAEASTGTPHGGINPEHENVQQGVEKMRDVGGYDRVYHMNRMMMAMAMHDGQSKDAVDMPEASWIEKYNTAHPYTDQEANMVAGAMKTIPTDHKNIIADRKSKEPDDVHKVSPVSARKKNKYGV